MKPVWMHCCIALCALSLAFTSAPAHGALAKTDAGTAIADNETLPFSSMNEALATLTIDDVKGFVEKARKFLEQILPERGDALLRRQLGPVIGNIKLQQLQDGKGAAVLIFPKGARVAFVEVSPEKSKAYATALSARGAKVASADGMLVISQRDDVVTAAKSIAREVREKLLGPERAKGIQVEVPVGRILAKYDAQVKAAMGGITAVMKMRQQMGSGGALAPTTATISLLELELRLIHNLAMKLDKVSLAMDLPPDGIRLDLKLIPKHSGNVTETTATRSAVSAANVMKLVPARGAMRFAMAADPDKTAAFLQKELGAALEDTHMEPAKRDAMMKLIHDWTTVVGSATAADMMVPGKTFISGSTVVEVRDPKGFLKLVEQLPDRLKASGIDRLYADMGVPIESEVALNVREEEGVPVHRFTIRMTSTGGGQQAAMMKAMMGDRIDYEFAIVDKYVVYALGGESVRELIDAVKAGADPDAKPTDAQKFFGPNAGLYCDYNIGRLLAMMSDSLPQGSLPPNAIMLFKSMANAVSDAPPVSIAGFSENGDYRVSVMVPAQMIRKFVEGGKQLRSARMQSRRSHSTSGTAESE